MIVAVTRNGLGDHWKFDSFEEADQHPLVQYGDVICRGPQHVSNQFTHLELPDYLRRLGDEGLRSEVLVSLREAGARRKEVLGRYEERIWRKMCELSRDPPSDATEIVELIRRDRKLSIKERAMNATTEAPKTAAPAAPKREPMFKEDQKITMLVDKDGKPYGKDNNPKRAGSKSADRFALYKGNGMTVKDAIAAGILMADLKYDSDHKFITIA